MFNGEQVALGEKTTELQDLQSADELERELVSLPQEVALYLQSLAHNFTDLIEDLMNILVESVKEREAARRLWERFGLPQTAIAVPVFIGLSEDLGRAQDEVQVKSEITRSFLAELIRAINQKVLMFYAMEINRVEEEKDDNNQAVDQLNSTETRGRSMRERTTESTVVFDQQTDQLEEEEQELKKSQSRWLDFIDKLTVKLPTMRSLETPIDLASPDPAMAL
jgi:DNA repair exonuclease SbcCD ATPase subunit